MRGGQREQANILLDTLAAGAPGYLPITALRERDALADAEAVRPGLHADRYVARETARTQLARSVGLTTWIAEHGSEDEWHAYNALKPDCEVSE